MAQIFHPSTNTISKVTIFGGVFILAGLGILASIFVRSSYVTQVGVTIEQPVQFSHDRHVNGNGLDCRYCHTSVEDSSFANIPPTHTCMTCHSQIWSNSPQLALVRESFETGEPIPWVRVHDMPDFVYFDHSIHIEKGIGCETCHGQVNEMPLIRKVNTMQMEWCLDCHRAPEKYIRPKEEVYTMGWIPPEDQLTLGARLVDEYNVNVEQLSNCSVCHR
jgi:hypothetical protein